MSVTFAVSSVDLVTAQRSTREAKLLLEQRGVRGIEAVAALPALVECEPYHGFLMAVHEAYASHHALVLSPDHVWLLISQGLARHINEHAEQLRSRLVRHEGKLNLSVRRDEFIPGAENDWPGVFAEFSLQLKEHLGGRRDLFLCDFSTTDFLARAASEVVLLGAVKQFFSLTVMSLCGIPKITLEGTPKDWKSIQQRVEALGEFDLSWWVEALRPVVAQFEAASRGEVDAEFWQELYKLHDASGGEQVTGWINVFFPYLGDTGDTRSPHLDSWKPKGFFSKLFSKDTNTFHKGPKLSEFPSGLTQAPFEWKFLLGSRDMSFSAGFFGVAQDADGALRPQLGWAVTDSLGSGNYSVTIVNKGQGEIFQVSTVAKSASLEGLVKDTRSLPAFHLLLWFSEALESLQGIEEAKNLEGIEIMGAKSLTDLSSLSGAPQLTILRLQQCDELQDLSAIGSLTGLTELAVNHCPKVTDLTFMVGLKTLTLLDLFGKTMPKEIAGRHNTPEGIARVQQFIKAGNPS